MLEYAPSQQTRLLSAATTTQTGASTGVAGVNRVVRARVTGTGAVSATINIYGAMNGDVTAATATLIGTLSPTGTTTAVDAFAMAAPWPEMFADLTAVSGTSAAVTVTVAS